jgi:8-oxo-dGTP diphosphatase
MPLAPAAIGIIFNDDRSAVLLIKRKDVPVWILPGGGIDPGETAEEAVIREILEETGYQIQIERKCAEYTPVNKLTAFTSVFICRIIKGCPALSNETSAISFYPLHQLPSSFFSIHKEWLDDALRSSTLIRKPLKGVSYKAVFSYFMKHPWQVIRYLFTRLFKN